jgi:hypothetical protein
MKEGRTIEERTTTSVAADGNGAHVQGQRRSFATVDLPERKAEVIASSRMSQEHEHLDAMLDEKPETMKTAPRVTDASAAPRRKRAERTPEEVEALVAEIMAIGKHCASLPVLDDRTLEEVLYDEHGLPK